MKNEFVPYEQALALKELESDEPYLGECFGEYRQWDGGKPYLQLYQDLDGCSTDPADYEYTTECIAPTYSQAFRWFRKKYNLDSFVKHLYKSTIKVGYYFGIDQYKGVEFQMDFDAWYDTYEEAELACLKKLIQITTPTA
jgi:hypothetical protein